MREEGRGLRKRRGMRFEGKGEGGGRGEVGGGRREVG